MSNLEANPRSDITKGKNTILRKQGMVPGIVYGGEEKNELISISKKHLKIPLRCLVDRTLIKMTKCG